MKTLKFVTELIPLILSGEKTSTWRLFDDKDLQVGDELSFINRTTGEEFSRARIISVMEKTFRMLEASDFDTHERYESRKEMFEVYRSRPYYGDRVTEDTTIKIINFELL